jgi:predicted lactoylglutathione lyase
MILQFDHLTIRVTDFNKAKAFYSSALKGLSCQLMKEFSPCEGVNVAGFGSGDRATFWITTDEPASKYVHIAFQASSRKQVDQFYEYGIKNGGRCNGKPGIRADKHPSYYAAYLFDLDGNNIEAVFRTE